MTYPRFERAAILLSAVVVVATTLATLRPTLDVIEILAQLLVFAVLVGALHWGRRGGAVAGVLAAVAYILMRTPEITQTGFTTELTWLVSTRVFTYGLIGVAGGELCSRLKYVLAELDDSAALDRETGLYSHGYVARAARAALTQFERYATPFTIVTVDVPGRDRRQRSAGPREVASHLRDAVRLVDDVGRLNDGRFVLLLHQTRQPGGETVAARARAMLHDSLKLQQEEMRTAVLGAAEDATAIRTFVGSLSSAKRRDDAAPPVAESQPSSSE